MRQLDLLERRRRRCSSLELGLARRWRRRRGRRGVQFAACSSSSSAARWRRTSVVPAGRRSRHRPGRDARLSLAGRRSCPRLARGRGCRNRRRRGESPRARTRSRVSSVTRPERVSPPKRVIVSLPVGGVEGRDRAGVLVAVDDPVVVAVVVARVVAGLELGRGCRRRSRSWSRPAWLTAAKGDGASPSDRGCGRGCGPWRRRRWAGASSASAPRANASRRPAEPGSIAVARIMPFLLGRGRWHFTPSTRAGGEDHGSGERDPPPSSPAEPPTACRSRREPEPRR